MDSRVLEFMRPLHFDRVELRRPLHQNFLKLDPLIRRVLCGRPILQS